MKISKLSYSDSSYGNTVSPLEFERLNMLVGVSGAGKTTILSAIRQLVEVASGETSRALRWSLEYVDDKANVVKWMGKQAKDYTVEESGEHVSKYLSESLTINDELVFERVDGKATFNNSPLPTLDLSLSLMHLLRDDKIVKSAYESLMHIVFIDVDSHEYSDTSSAEVLLSKVEDYIKSIKKPDIKKISYQLKKMPTRQKLYYASKYDKESYKEFLFVFTSIFPQVKKIQPVVLTNRVSPEQTHRALIFNFEMQNGSTVPQADVSSGMFKSMLVLAEIYLGSNSSPIIIDEIENSLGVNCLPDVLSELEVACNQIIMTSHHPRVINVIPTRNWKVVKRDENGTVHTYPAEAVIDKNSSQDTFFQLLNSELYSGD